MSKPRRDKTSFPLEDAPFAIKQRKAAPHEFVLDDVWEEVTAWQLFPADVKDFEEAALHA